MNASNLQFGLLGYGVIGKATHKSILFERNVIVHDIKNKTHISILKPCDVVFICIPTDTMQDILNLIECCVSCKQQSPNVKIIIRSTVPIGTCKRVQNIINDSVFYMPEFLRDRHWETDCLNRPIVLASDNQTIPEWLQSEHVVTCSLDDAEVLKMFSNNFAALRVVFANHFFDLAKKIGADYDTVLDLYQKTKHDQSYLDVNDNLRGFGGKCLTKDLKFLIETFEEQNLNQNLFDAVQKDNYTWPVTIRKF